MQDSFAVRTESRTQLGLGSTSSHPSGSGSRKLLRSTSRSKQTVAGINLKTNKWKKLRKTRERKVDLRAQYVAGEASSQCQERAVVSAPIIKPQQLSSTQVKWAAGNMQASFRERIQHIQPARQHEPLGSHPIVIPSNRHHHEQNGGSGTAPIPEPLGGKVPQNEAISTISRNEFVGGEPGNAPESSPPTKDPVYIDKDKEIERLEEQIRTLLNEREQLTEAASKQESEILDVKRFAFILFRQAHIWEIWSPIPEDPKPFMKMLKGLQTTMLWMQARIQWYEKKHPELREQYDASMGLF